MALHYLSFWYSMLLRGLILFLNYFLTPSNPSLSHIKKHQRDLPWSYFTHFHSEFPKGDMAYWQKSPKKSNISYYANLFLYVLYIYKCKVNVSVFFIVDTYKHTNKPRVLSLLNYTRHCMNENYVILFAKEQ